VVALAEEAEQAGWEGLLVWDHLGFVWGPPAADPWVTLAAVAARTSSLVLGTNVTPVPRRRPHVLAHQVATLDVLSGGRVVFAAGIGGVASEFT
jgi:alkanesulfonate monooxygenase SsuD/methylene tetrahydromethanopterin reductase-like flavin-dependent oxidoreductase (luciferase family)